MPAITYNNYEIEYSLDAFNEDTQDWCFINYDVYELYSACKNEYANQESTVERNKLFHLNVEWSGCSHLDLDDADSNLHLCGDDGYQDFFDLLRFLYDKSFGFMNR